MARCDERSNINGWQCHRAAHPGDHLHRARDPKGRSADVHQWTTDGVPPPRRAKLGEARQWLDEFLAGPHVTDDCVIWPFSCSGGYPQIGIGGKTYRVTRIVLTELVGPAPQDRGRIQAAHAPLVCHQPRCVNPRHLRWATPVENQADTLVDGTHTRGERHPVSTMTNAKALAIYHAKGSQEEIGRLFGVPRSTVADIKSGARWSGVTGHTMRTAEDAAAARAAGARRGNHNRYGHGGSPEECRHCYPEQVA